MSETGSFRSRDLAACLAARGVPLSIAVSRVADWTRRDFLRPSVRGPNSSPNLFSRPSLIVVQVLDELFELGAHGPILSAASSALYLEGALEAAAAGSRAGETWTLSVKTEGALGEPLSFVATIGRHQEVCGFEVALNPFLVALIGSAHDA